MRRFAKVELSFDKVLDETTILRFRHLLKKHRLTQKLFEAVKDPSPLQASVPVIDRRAGANLRAAALTRWDEPNDDQRLCLAPWDDLRARCAEVP